MTIAALTLAFVSLTASGQVAPSGETRMQNNAANLQFFGYDAFEASRKEVNAWREGQPESMRNPIPESKRFAVHVIGEALQPGKFLLPLGSRAFESIVRIGGPTESGSLRSIRLRKPNGNIFVLDLYPYLIQGDMRRDLTLEPGDALEFLPVGTRVSVLDGLRRPGIYEMRPEERLSDVILFARGPQKLGEPQKFVLENKSGMRSPLEVPLDQVGLSLLMNPALMAGDTIRLVPAEKAPERPAVYGYGFFEDARKQADLRRGLASPFTANGSGQQTPLPQTDRYQLGPGDALKIRITSTTEEPIEFDLKVDPSGTIVVPISGKQRTVRGMTPLQLQSNLNTEIRDYRRNARVEVYLTELRTMQITVMGEVYAPGSYAVPAVATTFQLLHLAGGPTENGSLRTIQLRRGGVVAASFDLYRFLLFGDPRQDTVLQPGDVVFIPSLGPRIELFGEFLRPGIYELAPNEKFRDALKLGGGLKSSAVAQRVSVESIRPGQARILVDVNASASGAVDNPLLNDGDIIRALSVRPEVVNQITIEGAVDQPGPYAYREGIRVADFLAMARGPLVEAYLERADLIRRNPDDSYTLISISMKDALSGDASANVALKPHDRLVIYSQKDIAWTQSFRVEVLGAVRRPGIYTRMVGMRVQDVLRMAGGTLGAASESGIFLQRYDPSGRPGELFRLQLSRIASGDPEQNMLVEDRDILSVYTVDQASYQLQAVVEVRGAVQRPGFYPRAQGMCLEDLIALAGGLLPDAGSHAEIAGAYQSSAAPARRVRLDANGADGSLKDGDIVTIPSDSSKRAKARTVTLIGAVAFPGPYTLSDADASLSGLIKRAGGLRPNAFPLGAQFLRKPENLVTQSQLSLAPQIIEALAIVNDAEYKRAVAEADLLKLQAIRNVTSSSTPLNVPGLGTPTAQSDIPLQEDIVKAVLERQTVSQARPLKESDFIPAGNINVQFEKALAKPGSTDDVTLLDGDIIIVPERPTSVSVAGALVLPSAVLFVPGKTLQYYVDRAGGTTLDAATDRMLIIKANGLVIRATSKTKIDLGDMIFVPTRVMALKLGDQQTNLEKAGRALSNGAIVYAIIRSILR